MSMRERHFRLRVRANEIDRITLRGQSTFSSANALSQSKWSQQDAEAMK